MGEITASEIPRIRQPQVSGWEVAAGISDQAEVEEMVISENITSIDQEAFQNLIDYVQEKCIGQRRPVSFNELKETDEFKQLLAECDLEGLEFTDYKNFLNWQNLQITQQALEEGQQDLEELNKAKEDFYNEYSKKIGKDLNTILTEYENQIQEVLNNYISDFSLNLSMVIDGSKYLNDDDLETYSKIIFEVLNNEGESQYTQDEIKNALTNKDANLEKIYEDFINNSNSSSNLLGNAIKNYYPAMSSYIESLNQQYNAQLENCELTIEEIKYILNSYDQNINQIEQQNKANEQLENDLYYAFIMGTEDYKNFKTPGEEGNVSVNIVGEGEFKYYWTPECDLSPIEYINYVLEKENITMEEFLNGKYTEFYIEAGNASNSGDYLHSDMSQLINLIKASEYDENLLKMYNYIYYTQGLEAANEYIYNTESNVNEKLAQVNVQAMLESMELNKEYTVMIEGEERNISFIVNDGKLAIKGLGDGVGNFFTGLVSWLNTNEHKTVEEYEQYYFLLSIMSKEDKIANGNLIDENGKSKLPYLDITKDYYNIGGEGVYQISQSIGNMIPSMLLSTINPTLGTVSMGISAGGNSFRDAVTSGYDLTDSIIYAVMSGASEAVLERLLGSIPGLGKTDETFVPTVSGWLRSCYSEGKEEFIQEGFDILLRGVIFGEEIDLAEAIKQMGVAGFYGAVTGAIMNGVALPFRKADLDSNLAIIAEANNGQLTNAQIAEMFGTTEAYVEEFMAKRKLNKDSSTTASDTTTNPQTSTSEGLSEISETAPETENIPTAEQTSNSTGETDTNISITEVEQLQKKYDLTDTQIAEIKATAYTIENAEEIAIILYQAKSHPTSMSGITAEQANLMLTLIENNEINSFFTEDGFINDEIFKSEYEKIKNFSDETIREARRYVINEKADSLLKVCEIMTEDGTSGEIAAIMVKNNMTQEEAENVVSLMKRENVTEEIATKSLQIIADYNNNIDNSITNSIKNVINTSDIKGLDLESIAVYYAQASSSDSNFSIESTESYITQIIKDASQTWYQSNIIVNNYEELIEYFRTINPGAAEAIDSIHEKDPYLKKDENKEQILDLLSQVNFKNSSLYLKTVNLDIETATLTLREIQKEAQLGHYEVSVDEVLNYKIQGYNTTSNENKQQFINPLKKTITGNDGTNYTEYFPTQYVYQSDKGTIDYTLSLLSEETKLDIAKSCNIDIENINSITIDQLGTYLKNYKDKTGNFVPIEVITFQNAAVGANNYVTYKGDLGGTYAGSDIAGAFSFPTSYLKELSQKYPSIFSYNQNTKEIKIYDMEKFGQEVLGGVPLSSDGVYICKQTITLNGETSVPSVVNGSSYLVNNIPGGFLPSGIPEIVVPGVKIDGYNGPRNYTGTYAGSGGYSSSYTIELSKQRKE